MRHSFSELIFRHSLLFFLDLHFTPRPPRHEYKYDFARNHRVLEHLQPKSLDLNTSSQNHHDQPDFVFTFAFVFSFSDSYPATTRDPMPVQRNFPPATARRVDGAPRDLRLAPAQLARPPAVRLRRRRRRRVRHQLGDRGARRTSRRADNPIESRRRLRRFRCDAESASSWHPSVFWYVSSPRNNLHYFKKKITHVKYSTHHRHNNLLHDHRRHHARRVRRIPHLDAQLPRSGRAPATEGGRRARAGGPRERAAGAHHRLACLDPRRVGEADYLSDAVVREHVPRRHGRRG